MCILPRILSSIRNVSFRILDKYRNYYILPRCLQYGRRLGLTLAICQRIREKSTLRLHDIFKIYKSPSLSISFVIPYAHPPLAIPSFLCILAGVRHSVPPPIPIGKPHISFVISFVLFERSLPGFALWILLVLGHVSGVATFLQCPDHLRAKKPPAASFLLIGNRAAYP